MSDFSKKFKESSVAEFFKKNRHMLGLYGKIRSLTTVVAEFVCNSLDACEEAGILPEIKVQIKELGKEHYELEVIDNGPGIPENKLGKALGKLLAGTKFHRLIQTRGQQGLGASGSILFSQMTTGKPAKIISATKGKKAVYIELEIDVKKNEPKIRSKKILNYDFRGLAIKLEYKNVLYKKNKQNAYEYLKRTAIANPHARIEFIDPYGEKHIFERSINKMPKKPIEIKAHIKSLTVDDLLSYARNNPRKSLSVFLKEYFDRVGDKTIKEIEKKINFNIKDKMGKLDWQKGEQLISAIQNTKTFAPRTDALIEIGEDYLRKSLKNILDPESLSVISRKATVYKGGYPFQVEAAIAYNSKNSEAKLEIMRFSNRAPLLFDAGSCAITKAVQSIDWKRYNLKDIDSMPISIFVNISSVHIPYTNVGKQAIADEKEIVEEIRKALMLCARNISIHISRKKNLETRIKKQKIFVNYAKEIALALSILTNKDREKILYRLNEIIKKKLKLEGIE